MSKGVKKDSLHKEKEEEMQDVVCKGGFCVGDWVRMKKGRMVKKGLHTFFQQLHVVKVNPYTILE